MQENNKDKLSTPGKAKETTQAVLVSGVIITMLYLAGFPMFLLFFLGMIAFLIYKVIDRNQPKLGEGKAIFEFYLAAHDILRDDDRKWFGFEIQETIQRGERILQAMPDPPPLLYYTLGSLYNKIGSHKTAVENLAYLVENESSDERNRTVASPELRHYVQILRRIEQNPAEAPQTSAALRALERGRRNRAASILEESRKELWLLEEKRQSQLESRSNDEEILKSRNEAQHTSFQTERPAETEEINSVKELAKVIKTKVEEVVAESNRGKKESESFKRQPISEVLHDIYDRK